MFLGQKTETLWPGFGVRFDNGWSISVQWSKQHMCGAMQGMNCSSAEVLVFPPMGVSHKVHKLWDQPLANQTPEQVASILARVAKKERM